MKKLVILSIIAFVIFAGCADQPKTEGPAGDGQATTSEATGEGTGVGTDWCQAGAAWSASGMDSQSGDSSFNYIIKGMTNYKGNSVCEAEAKVTQSGETFLYTYYFSEDGKYGAMVMKDESGKVLSENEFSSP